MNGHPSFEEILNAVEGRAASEGVAAHLASCAECREATAGAKRLLAAMTTARTLDAVPAEVHRRTLARVREELAAAAGAAEPASFLRGLLGRLAEAVELTIGTLVADSLQPSTATRAGTSDATAPRMLLYETADYDVTLSLARDATRGTIGVTGQVTPRSGELPDEAVAGIRAGEHTATAEISPYGEFAFEAVPEGRVEVEIGLGPLIIRLNPVHAGE